MLALILIVTMILMMMMIIIKLLDVVLVFLLDIEPILINVFNLCLFNYLKCKNNIKKLLLKSQHKIILK